MLKKFKKVMADMLLLERIKAFITDIFMINMPILYISTYLVLGSKEAFLQSEVAHFVCVLLYALITSFLFSKKSQTLGYMYAEIILLDMSAKEVKIGFFRALFRFIVFIFSMGLVFGIFVPFIRKDRRFFHDIVCNTILARHVRDKNKI